MLCGVNATCDDAKIHLIPHQRHEHEHEHEHDGAAYNDDDAKIYLLPHEHHASKLFHSALKLHLGWLSSQYFAHHHFYSDFVDFFCTQENLRKKYFFPHYMPPSKNILSFVSLENYTACKKRQTKGLTAWMVVEMAVVLTWPPFFLNIIFLLLPGPLFVITYFYIINWPPFYVYYFSYIYTAPFFFTIICLL